jgi:hypothetical protein
MRYIYLAATFVAVTATVFVSLVALQKVILGEP